MKLRIQVGSTLPSYVYTLMYGFEVTIGSEWWCSVLGSDLCIGQSVLVDWLDLIKFQWMVESVVTEVQ